MRTKQEIKNHRQAVLSGVIGGIFFFLLFRVLLKDRSEAFNSLFFSGEEHWPVFVKSFIPLDVAFSCLFCYIPIRLIVNFIDSDETESVEEKEPESFRDKVMLPLGLTLGLGCWGGIAGSGLYGWYFSLEGFVIACVFILAFGGVLLGLGKVMDFLMLGIIHFFKLLAALLRPTWIGRPFVRFGRYMNADGVPEAPEDA